MNSFLFILVLFIILIYLLLIDDTQIINKNKNIYKDKKNKKKELNNAFVYIIPFNNKNFSLSINSNNRLYLTNDNSKSEIFKIIKNYNRLAIQSTTLGNLLMINYTSFHNYDYDVNIQGVSLQNNATKLKLIKDKNKYYLKFYNNYYLCVNNTGNIFACKDKSKIFYFKFKKII